jgi:SH3-like domain-containing protein
MAGNTTGNRRFRSILIAAACLAVAGLGTWKLLNRHGESVAANGPAAGDTTGSIATPARNAGPSGLPLPRFVSLKAEKVNVRRGPSSDYPVAWVFQRKGLPVEIVAEFENWRRIRDSDGAEGWILQNMLSGKRTAMMAPWRQDQMIPLYGAASKDSGMVAKIGAGVVGDVEKCTDAWCEVSAGGYDGFVEQSNLWGVYPDEQVD